MADPTPQEIVGSKCIEFSEALLEYRRAIISDDQATREGQDLFGWFRNVGAIASARAGIAARCVDLGVTLLRKSNDSYDRIRDRVKENYTTYSAGA